MSLADVLERSTDDARRIKEYICRKSAHNMRRLVTWYRGDHSVALAVLMESDRDQLLEVTGHGIYGFGADAVAISSDAWLPAKIKPFSDGVRTADQLRAMSDDEVAAQNPHPVTGRPLEHGDLNKLAEEGGLERGLLAEAIMTQATNRAGYQHGSLLEFRFAGGNLVWGEERRLLDEGKGSQTDVMRGAISEALVSQMNQPSLQQIQVGKGLDFTLHERDILTVGMIHARKLPARVILLPEGADHLRVLRENNLLSGW